MFFDTMYNKRSNSASFVVKLYAFIRNLDFGVGVHGLREGCPT
jgi:hypothetical protein